MRGSKTNEYGPGLPYTIQPYHNQKWAFDISELFNLWKKLGRSKKCLIEIHLATGKQVEKKLDAVYLFRYLLAKEQIDAAKPDGAEQIAESTNEHEKEPNPNGEAGNKQP